MSESKVLTESGYAKLVTDVKKILAEGRARAEAATAQDERGGVKFPTLRR
jgi:hypothetical protein